MALFHSSYAQCGVCLDIVATQQVCNLFGIAVQCGLAAQASSTVVWSTFILFRNLVPWHGAFPRAGARRR